MRRLRLVARQRWLPPTFQTATGTDTITALTLSLGSMAAGLSLVEITDSAGSTGLRLFIKSVERHADDQPGRPASPQTTSATTYKVRVTPKSHAANAERLPGATQW